MFLIDYPYVSDFLKSTLAGSETPVIKTPVAEEIMEGYSPKWISISEAVARMERPERPKLYTNSENTIYWLQQFAGHTPIPESLSFFKDKHRFRGLVKAAFPDYFFTQVAEKELDSLDVSRFPFPFIIKPAVGFFSLGVFKVDSPEHWQEVLPALKAQLLATQDMYPGEVVNTQQFLIESYIRGEEYAIDCYLDAAGEPVILNIMHHWFTSEADVSDRVYCASLATWKRLHEPVLAFLKVLAQVTGLKNFPLHLEVRQQEDGRIIPIEVNPMRFGGFCTTADVAHFAFGLNAYEAFMQEQRPDIEAMMQAKPDALFALVLLDNTSGIPADEIAGFNFPALERDLTGILHVRKLPFSTYGVFGFVFTETPLEKRHELEQLLHSDLKKYVVRKDAVTRPTPC